MKLFVIILWGSIVTANINVTQAAEVNISVTDIDVKKGGNVAVFIFTGEKGYPKNHKEAKWKKVKKASGENIMFNFNIPENINNIAIKVHHDFNFDGKVTKNWTGIIPKDGLGFSNKQKLRLSGIPQQFPLFSKNPLQKRKILYEFMAGRGKPVAIFSATQTKTHLS